VAQAADHLHLVADQQDRHAEAAVGVGQHAEQVQRGARVEGRGGLVGQQHVGLGGQRAGDGDALLLAAGEAPG
jgi:hypothetical protein